MYLPTMARNSLPVGATVSNREFNTNFDLIILFLHKYDLQLLKFMYEIHTKLNE